MNPSIFSTILAKLLVNFYVVWHGKLHLKGAGRLISRYAPRIDALQKYPLSLPNGNTVHIDLQELSGFGWLNTSLGEITQEEGLIRAIVRNLDKDSVFWDVGANAGIVSYLVAERIRARQHHYFEPNPVIFPWASAALEGESNLTGHNFALSDRAGKSHLHVPLKRSAYASLGTGSREDGVEMFEIATVTGDELVYDKGYDAPDIVKIDTEGHEILVLAGMSRIITEHSPIIFFEHIVLTDEDIANILPENYEISTVANADGAILFGFDRHAGHNSVMIPKGKAVPRQNADTGSGVEI